MTLTAFAVAPWRCTVKTTSLPSTAEAPVMEKLGDLSPSRIVTTALSATIVPEDPVTSIVSLGSSRLSLSGVSTNEPVPLSAPAAIVTVKSVTVA